MSILRGVLLSALGGAPVWSSHFAGAGPDERKEDVMALVSGLQPTFMAILHQFPNPEQINRPRPQNAAKLYRTQSATRLLEKHQ
jgi:hypothetical protein